tara:strand:- start:2077 stop:2301 length:225 start_codon:yes stop_codon:yes gene_type:complete
MINFTESLTAGVPITERNTFLATDLDKVLGYDSGLVGEPELYKFLFKGDCDICRSWQWYICNMMKGTEAWRHIL